MMNGRRLNGTWAPGVSGSPGGKPKLTDEQRAGLEVIRTELTTKSVDALRKILDGFLAPAVIDAGGDMAAQIQALAMDARLALEAAKQVLQRSFGKPEQAIALISAESAPQPPPSMTLEEMLGAVDRERARILSEMAKRSGGNGASS